MCTKDEILLHTSMLYLLIVNLLRFTEKSGKTNQMTNGWSLIRDEMPKLLPIKPMISNNSQAATISGNTSVNADNSSVSKLRLVRPWENGKTRKKSDDDSISEDSEILNDEQMPEQYVPLKKRRMIMYELDSKYSGVNFQNCH